MPTVTFYLNQTIQCYYYYHAKPVTQETLSVDSPHANYRKYAISIHSLRDRLSRPIPFSLYFSLYAATRRALCLDPRTKIEFPPFNTQKSHIVVREPIAVMVAAVVMSDERLNKTWPHTPSAKTPPSPPDSIRVCFRQIVFELFPGSETGYYNVTLNPTSLSLWPRLLADDLVKIIGFLGLNRNDVVTNTPVE